MSLLTSFFQKNTDENNTSNPSHFYFYFPNSKKIDAEKFGDRMRSNGYDTKLHLIEGEVNPNNEWSVNASRVLSSKDIQNLDRIEDELRDLALQYGGDYDGHEIPVNN